MKLKLVLYSFAEGHTFTFTNPAPVATAEREQFKNEITNHISRNRTSRASGQLSTDAPATPATPNNFAAPPPRTSTIRPPGGTPRASSIASDRSGSANDVDYQLRKRVLLNSPELATLHRELVMAGQITENEFWDGREVHKYNLYRLLTFVSDCFRHEAFTVRAGGHGKSKEREIWSTRRSSSTDC